MSIVAETGWGQVVQSTQPATTRATTMPTTRRAEQPDITWVPAWPDTQGKHINAHGGNILFHEGVYYWYGEARGIRSASDQRRWVPLTGVSVYSSTDLKNWKNLGHALEIPENDSTSEIARGCAIERPKVIYNQKTKKFVMWFHYEAPRASYGTAKAGLAISDSPTGPFKYLIAYRPNAGIWPIDMEEQFRTPLDRTQVDELMKADRNKALREGVYTRRDFAIGQMSRDMTIFVDHDQKAYLLTSAEENFTLDLHELTDDYLGFTGKWMRIMPGGHNEAPAMINHDGTYYLLASGATGWAPNPARYFTAKNIWGPWERGGNPCEGKNPHNNHGPELTFGGQSTFIFPDPNQNGQYIAMFDIWRPRDIATSAHLWLPLTIENGKMIIRWAEPEFAGK